MVQPNRSTVRYPGYDQFSQLKVDSAPSSAGKGNCFSQLGANALEPGSIPSECWRSIPAWMRCSMVVVSTGPGGSGVAFHKPGVSGWPSSKVESAGGCTHHKVRQRRQLPEVISHLSPKHRHKKSFSSRAMWFLCPLYGGMQPTMKSQDKFVL